MIAELICLPPWWFDTFAVEASVLIFGIVIGCHIGAAWVRGGQR